MDLSFLYAGQKAQLTHFPSGLALITAYMNGGGRESWRKGGSGWWQEEQEKELETICEQYLLLLPIYSLQHLYMCFKNI